MIRRLLTSQRTLADNTHTAMSLLYKKCVLRYSVWYSYSVYIDRVCHFLIKMTEWPKQSCRVVATWWACWHETNVSLFDAEFSDSSLDVAVDYYHNTHRGTWFQPPPPPPAQQQQQQHPMMVPFVLSMRRRSTKPTCTTFFQLATTKTTTTTTTTPITTESTFYSQEPVEQKYYAGKKALHLLPAAIIWIRFKPQTPWRTNRPCSAWVNAAGRMMRGIMHVLSKMSSSTAKPQRQQ